MSDFIRDLGSVVIVIHRYKRGKWGSKKRQIDCNVIVKRFQKLGILIGNARRKLTETSKIYSYINRVIDCRKKCFDMFLLLGFVPCLFSSCPAIYQCVKEAVKQLSH